MHSLEFECPDLAAQAVVADGLRWKQLTVYVDNQPIGEFTSSPARAFWMLQPGTHLITAKVIDEQGKVSESETVRVVVTQ